MPLSKCPKCKGVVSTSTNKCIACGEPFKVCPNCQSAVSLDVEKCPECGGECENVGTAAAHSHEKNYDYIGTAYPDKPMKWYKFLIYFLLYAIAVCNILFGVTFIHSAIDLEELVFLLLGIYSMGYGIFAIITRYKLAKFKKSGPICFYIMLIANLALSVISALALGNGNTIFKTIFTLTIGLIILGIHYDYFEKRRDYFDSMVLSKCPKCKSLVSTSSNKCMKCGEPFKVCPGCQTAVAVNAKKCRKCGHQFVENADSPFSDPAIQDHGAPLDDIKTVEQLEDKWKETVSPTLNKANILLKTDTVLFFALFAFGALLLIAALFKLEGLLVLGSIMFAMCGLYIKAGRPLVAVISHMELTSIWTWSRDNGYDLCEMHRAEVNELKETCEISKYESKHKALREKNGFALTSAFISSRFFDKKKLIIQSLIRFAIGLVFVFSIILAAVALYTLEFDDIMDSGDSILVLGICACIDIIIEPIESWYVKRLERNDNALQEYVIDRIEMGEDIGLSKE